MSEAERRLLKKLAEVYAFLDDVQHQAEYVGDVWVVKLTKGIDFKVAELTREYPRLFRRYFNKAQKKARLDVVIKRSREGGKRENTPRWEEEKSQNRNRQKESKRRQKGRR